MDHRRFFALVTTLGRLQGFRQKKSLVRRYYLSTS